MESWNELFKTEGVEEHSIHYGKKNILIEKAYDFSQEIVLYVRKIRKLREYDLARQLFRSGTSIGANVLESTAASSPKDFAHKLSIASKEARESYYWLMLIKDTEIELEDVNDLLDDCLELVKLTTSIVKTLNEKSK